MLVSFPQSNDTNRKSKFYDELVGLARRYNFDIVICILMYISMKKPPSLLILIHTTWYWELYSLTKGYSMAGWRVALPLVTFIVLTKLKSYIDSELSTSKYINSCDKWIRRLSTGSIFNLSGKKNISRRIFNKIPFEVYKSTNNVLWAKLPEVYKNDSEIFNWPPFQI